MVFATPSHQDNSIMDILMLTNVFNDEATNISIYVAMDAVLLYTLMFLSGQKLSVLRLFLLALYFGQMKRILIHRL